MNIHYFQHTPSEGLGKIRDWAHDHGHALSGTHFDRRDRLPNVEDIDWLIVMGGPMNVYQYRDYPWLREEKQCITSAIERDKTVLGICLGAQLIADVLGAKVVQNPEIEIGWFPVRFLDAAHTVRAFEKFPRELTVLHWHGDTFELPPGALALAESDGCQNQAFAVGNNLIGLQFHIEVTPDDVCAFLDGEPNETLGEGRFIQTRAQILAGEEHMQSVHQALENFLDALAGQTSVSL